MRYLAKKTHSSHKIKKTPYFIKIDVNKIKEYDLIINMYFSKRIKMLDMRTKIGAGGRVIIPSVIREKLHLSVGDEVIIHVKEEELYITTTDHALRKIREKVKKNRQEKVSLVDELLAVRRTEASCE